MKYLQSWQFLRASCKPSCAQRWATRVLTCKCEFDKRKSQETTNHWPKCKNALFKQFFGVQYTLSHINTQLWIPIYPLFEELCTFFFFSLQGFPLLKWRAEIYYKLPTPSWFFPWSLVISGAVGPTLAVVQNYRKNYFFFFFFHFKVSPFGNEEQKCTTNCQLLVNFFPDHWWLVGQWAQPWR